MPLQELQVHDGQQSNACTLISVAVIHAILSAKDEADIDAMRRRVGQAHDFAEGKYQELLQAETDYKQIYASTSIQLASDAEESSLKIEEQRRQLLEQLGAARNRYVDLLSQLSDASDSSILLERNIGMGNGLLEREALKFFSSRYLPSSATALKPFELGPQTEVSVTDKIDVRQTCEFLLLELRISYKNSDGVLTPKELDNFYTYSFKHFEAMGVLGKLAALEIQHDSDEELCQYWQDLTLDRFIEWVNTSATHAAPTPSFADAISALPPNRGMTILVHAHTISVTRKGDVYYGYDSWTGRLVYSNDSREIVDWVTGSPNFQAHRPQILTISQWTPTFLGPAPGELADMAFTSSSSSTDMPSASHSTTRSPHEPPSATPPSPPNERNPSSAPTPHPLTTSQPGPSPVSGGHVATARRVFEQPGSLSTPTLPSTSRSSPQRGVDPRRPASGRGSSWTSPRRESPQAPTTSSPRGGPRTRSRVLQPGPGSASPHSESSLPTPISPTSTPAHTSPVNPSDPLPSFGDRRQLFEQFTSPPPPTPPAPLLPKPDTSTSSGQGSSDFGRVKELSKGFMPKASSTDVLPTQPDPDSISRAGVAALTTEHEERISSSADTQPSQPQAAPLLNRSGSVAQLLETHEEHIATSKAAPTNQPARSPVSGDIVAELGAVHEQAISRSRAEPPPTKPITNIQKGHISRAAQVYAAPFVPPPRNASQSAPSVVRRPTEQATLPRTSSHKALPRASEGPVKDATWWLEQCILPELQLESGEGPPYANDLASYLGAISAVRDDRALTSENIQNLRVLREKAEHALLSDLNDVPILKQCLLDARTLEECLLINTQAEALRREASSTTEPNVADREAHENALAALEQMLRDEANGNGKYQVQLDHAAQQKYNRSYKNALRTRFVNMANALAQKIYDLAGVMGRTGGSLPSTGEGPDSIDSTSAPQPDQQPLVRYARLMQLAEPVLAHIVRRHATPPQRPSSYIRAGEMPPPPTPSGVLPAGTSQLTPESETRTSSSPPLSTTTTPQPSSLAPQSSPPQETTTPPGSPTLRPASPASIVTTPIPVPSASSDETSSPSGSPLRPVSPATTPISVSSLPFHETSSPSSSLLPPAPVVSTITPIPVIPSPSVSSASPPSSPAFVRLGSPPPLSDTGTTSLSGVVPTPVVNTPSPAHAAGYIPIGQTGTSGSGGETSQTPDEVACADIFAKVAPYLQQEARRAKAERQRQEQERQRAEEEAARQREAARLQAERQRAEQERQRAEAERRRIAEEEAARLRAEEQARREEEARRQAEEEARRLIPPHPPSPEPGSPVPLFMTTTLTEQPATVEITAPGSPAPLEIDDDDLLLNPLHIDDDPTAAPVAMPTLDDLLERFRYHIARGNFNVFDIDENNARAPGNSFSRFMVTPDSQDASVNVITYQYSKGIRKGLLSGANALRGDIQFSDVELDDMARMPGNAPSDAIRDESVKAKLVQGRVTCVIENTDENPASSISRMQLAFELIATESSPGKARLLRSAAVIKADGYQGDDKVRELARAATQAICRGVLPMMPPQELQAVCTWLYRHDNGNYSGFVNALTTMALEIRHLDQGSRHIKDFIIEKYKAMRPASNSLLSPNINANDPIGMLIADYKRISSEDQKPNESTQAADRQALTM